MSDPRPPSRHWRASGLVAVAAVLLASGAAGFLSYRLFVRPAGTSLQADAPAAVLPVPRATVTDTATEASAPPPPKVPERLPDLRLPGADGKSHRLADWEGRPLVVNFWATWCDPCRREIPLLKKLRREHASNRLEIVGIAIDYADLVRKYVSDNRIDYPVLLGGEDGLKSAMAFGVEPVLPFSVFADRQGRVVALRIGELHRDEAELILGRIRDVDAGTLSLVTAQAQISAGMGRLREARAAQN